MNRLLAAASALSVLAIASQASAADLAARPVYTKAPEYAPVVNSWVGLYIGGNVGYGWGNGNMTFGDAAPAPSIAAVFAPNQILNSHVSGAVGGGQIGYNWQIGSFVTGLEADFQGSGVKGASSTSSIVIIGGPTGVTSNASSETTLNWFGTARGSLGVAVTPQLLLYGTGGLAFGEVHHAGNFNLGGVFGNSQIAPASVNQTQTGWAAGVGAEWKFTRGWSAKVEYLHIDLGSSSVTGGALFNGVPITLGAVAYSWNNRLDIVRAGLNYHFN